MKTLQTTFILALLLFFIVGLGGLVYLAGTVGILPASDSRIIETPFVVSPIPTLAESPIERYSRIDSAIINVLDYRPSNYGTGEISVFDIQPIGIYIPRTGDTQFEIAAPTAQPTPLPFPTSPPLPLPPLAEIATLVPGTEPRTLPYAGDNCAPSGNPVDGILTQRFHRYHSGIDIGVPFNTPVIATHSGTVTYADWSEIGYGYLVIIQSGQYITYYAHNTSFNVEVGTLVGKGSIVAWSGSTGNSSGPHSHYETRINDIPVDPLTFESRNYPSC
ncbi:MAG: M23 family metallopeptidase [Anaerolineae bacterium]|nr:M23 family metallopeptidase [Anaerolineae bacterium]